MTHSTFTDKDNGRRNLSLLDQRAVEKVLPEYYRERYPKLITFLEKYYDWADSDVSPSHHISDLFIARDVGQTPDALLDFLEDELLLGQEYFGGFLNKRAAAKISNIFYRSKGTKYSIQQFFNAFFGIDVDVEYTKSQRFIVGESEIGFDSQKFLTNAELYQVFAVLIKSELPLSEWRDVYKLFVHPAGMYLGSQLQVVSEAEATLSTDSALDAGITFGAITLGSASLVTSAIADTTGIVLIDSAGGDRLRQDNNAEPITLQTAFDLGLTMGQVDSAYDNIAELMDTNSFRLDEDSGDASVMTIDNTIEQMDEVNYKYYDSTA